MAATSRPDAPSIEGVDDRTVRAATRSLTVLPSVGTAKNASGLFTVVSDSGSEYVVDLYAETCTCPDHEYRDARCLHIRRAEMAVGELTVPDAIPDDRVDPMLGEHCEGVEWGV